MAKLEMIIFAAGVALAGGGFYVRGDLDKQSIEVGNSQLKVEAYQLRNEAENLQQELWLRESRLQNGGLVEPQCVQDFYASLEARKGDLKQQFEELQARPAYKQLEREEERINDMQNLSTGGALAGLLMV